MCSLFFSYKSRMCCLMQQCEQSRTPITDHPLPLCAFCSSKVVRMNAHVLFESLPCQHLSALFFQNHTTRIECPVPTIRSLTMRGVETSERSPQYPSCFFFRNSRSGAGYTVSKDAIFNDMCSFFFREVTYLTLLCEGFRVSIKLHRLSSCVLALALLPKLGKEDFMCCLKCTIWEYMFSLSLSFKKSSRTAYMRN
jgi:hypothetical protein